ncbi:ParA family protein (plasmid) [Gemmobacter fulvus]|uniref:ParA family protein n=1 Tax=Gemmobacter fulvus TaxID=2840474 RepID=A0A975PB79_9RHOB|nr:AAA family ATPase [Gemmobacter fulvus]MBT9247682.1 ParA family protein [Gemmobacter fulvus]QWK92865.1 ParA family protein [Gemmobacter fulvus]
MHYHETIVAAVELLLRCGESVTREVCLVRDASGRLTLVAQKFKDSSKLKDAFKERLGNYATDIGVMEGGIAATVSKAPQSMAKDVFIQSHDKTFEYTYVDNRVVGEDWLSSNPPHDKITGAKRFIFYSLKGGVGRSTALAVYAAHLASQGKKSLVIDLDIEAPGLGSILLSNSKDSRSNLPRFGVIDYLLENGITGVREEDLNEFISTSALGSGAIDVLPAVGYETESRPELFVEKLSRALTEDFVGGKKHSLARQVREMVDAFDRSAAYDAILIDARAGFSEITAATLMGMSAQLIFFGIDQNQTFSGYRYLLSHLISQTDFSDGAVGWREKIAFVQSKAPGTKRERSSFKAELFEVCADTIYDQMDGLENEEDLFTFSPSDESFLAPHNAAYIRYDAAFSAFDPLRHEEQVDPELFSGAYAKFIERLDQLIEDGVE